MRVRNPTIIVIILVVFIFVFLLGITRLNFQYSQQNPKMNNFQARWLGTRFLLLNGWSPYSDQTTSEIQNTVYGRQAREGEDPGYFVFPLYSILFYVPFALTQQYSLANAVWMTLLEVCIVGLIVASVTLSNWRPNLFILISLIIFTIFWYFTIRPVLNGNFSVVASFLIVISFLAIRAEMDSLAGFLLALGTIKPQIVLVLYIFIVLWAISNRRWMIISSLLGSLFLLSAAGSLFVPDWFVSFIRQIVLYSESKFITTAGSVMVFWLPGVGKQVGWLLTGVLLGLLIIEWRAAFRKQFNRFYWTALLTLAATPLIGIYSTIEYYIVLYPAMVMIFAVWDKRWGRFGQWLTVLFLIVSSIGFWIYLLNGVERGIQPDLDPVIFYLFPIMIIFGLYWVKWWAMRPVRLPLEELAARVENFG